MEIWVLFLLTIIIDFILVIFIEENQVNYSNNNNQDWLYFTLVSIIGIVVFLNTFRLKHWLRTLSSGIGLFAYDLIYITFILYAWWLLPHIMKSLKVKYGTDQGREYFLCLYPFLDMGVETTTDFMLNHSQYAELYVYQAYMMLVGVRVGVLMLVPCDLFQFWFCLLVLAFFRMNNSSLFATILVRRFIYYQSPTCIRPITAMDEVSQALKVLAKRQLYIGKTWSLL